MKQITIEESDMIFGPYPADRCFHVEKSPVYRQIEEGVKIAEFLLCRHGAIPTVWIIEAKKSSPRQEDQKKFEEFLQKIRDKLVNAFSLYMAVGLQRHDVPASSLPGRLRNIDFATTEFKFALVIKGHQNAWLPPLQDAISKVMRATVKTWGISPNSVIVMNDEMARSRGFIGALVPA